jgi:D-alanyl-D-alanine carboxypeptidase
MQEAPVKPGRGSDAALLAMVFLTFALFLPFSSSIAAAPLNASIVIDVASGEVLSQSNADAQTYPASLTKMMTLYLAFEALQKGTLSLDQPLAISADAANEPPTKLGLYPGQTITVGQAIRGMIIKSANDAAVVMAEAISGSTEAFAQKMNAKAQALGMTRTYFRNPNGLPNLEQRTTARDLARLAMALYRDFPRYYPMFAETRFTFHGRVLITHNRFVLRYPGADGLKTGYINASGFNLAASAVRNGRRIIGVVLGGRSPGLRDAEMWALLDRGFGTVTPRSMNNSLLLASAPGVVPGLKPDAAQGDSGAEDDTLEDGTASPLIAPSRGVAGPSPIIPQEGSTTKFGAAAQTLSAPLVELQILEPPSVPAAPATKTTAKAAIRPLRLATVIPPQLKPVSAETTGIADGVPLAINADRGWGIQVGAYARYSPARQAAIKAQQTLPLAMPLTRIAVDESDGRAGRLYRARLVGFAESEAAEACRALRGRDISCLVVKSNLSVAERPAQ